MKVTGICGSPRKGNTEWMLETVLNRLSQKGAETELFLLRKSSIKSCTGCLKCEDRKGICSQKDNMSVILPRLLAADCILMGSPVYFEMVSGQMKTFMDRTCPIWTMMGGKLLICTAVAEEGIGDTVRNFKTYGKVCGMRWGGAVTVLAKTPKQASQDELLKSRLLRLADRAFQKIR